MQIFINCVFIYHIVMLSHAVDRTFMIYIYPCIYLLYHCVICVLFAQHFVNLVI